MSYEDVVINVVSMQTSDEGDKADYEASYTGKLNIIKGVIYIRYDEILEGMDRPTSNIVKLYPDRMHAEIIKKGAIKAHLSFTAGQKSHTFYETPFGTISLATYTSQVDIGTDEDCIGLFLDYSIDAGYETVSQNTLRMNIKLRNPLP